MKENKGVSLTGFVITILVVLLAVAVAGCVYLLKNPVKEEVVVQNPAPVVEQNSSSEVKENKEINNSQSTSLIKINDDKNFNAEAKIYNYISEEEGEDSIRISYIVNGKNKGKLEITKNNKIIHTKSLDKAVISINSLDYAYERNIFFLFEDGTVGKMEVDNIEKGKYDIKSVKEATNIVRIQEVIFENKNAGPDLVLVGVDNKGKTITLDTISV